MKALLLAIALLLAVASPALRVQGQVLEDTVFTLGTVTRDQTNRNWAYLVLQPTDSGLLADRKLAVYVKSGDTTSATPYERQAILTLQTDPLAITALLQRAGSIGEDLAALDGRVSNLFAALIPSGTPTLAERLSVVIRGSLDKPQHYQKLVQLARFHPAVAMCLGFGHAEQIGNGKYTFEVRDFDLGANADRGVLGRVTVESGNPIILPAPGRPVESKDPSGKGHLNVKLRWATSPELRRLSLLSYGFNVYRVPKFVADSNPGLFLAGVPNRLQFLAQVKTNPAIGRVTQLPVLASRNFDDSPAANPNSVLNPTNRVAFVADDGGLSGGTYVFQDGQQFFYYVTARDLLGRDGVVSQGTLVTICDRMPPDAPRIPAVENHYVFQGGAPKQHLKVTWRPVPSTNDDSGISGYYVYRWTAPAQIPQNANQPLLNRISALIPHVPGQPTYTFIDSGAGAPGVPADVNKTFWYTIRAVDLSSCGGNLSANSAPAFGVLRDREGPAAPNGGGPAILCCDPLLVGGKAFDVTPNDKVDPEMVDFDLVCTRRDNGIAFADFWFSSNGGSSSNFVGRVYFAETATEVTRRLSYPRRQFDGNTLFVASARSGDFQGDVSVIDIVRVGGLPERTRVRRVEFEATTRCQRTQAVAGSVGRKGCDVHQPQPPAAVGDPVTPPESGVIVVLPLTPQTREYRLYRRVDYGPLTLIKQGQTNYDSVTNVVVQIPDEDMPANASVLCYYGQLFDEHGNGSPMTQLGDCITVTQPTAKPLLSALESLGGDAAPRMVIRWFCSPAGLERFKVQVAVLGESPPNSMGAVLSTNQASGIGLQPLNPYLPFPLWKLVDFGEYVTPLIGPNFGDGASFQLTVPVVQGKRYYVKVTGVVKAGGAGKTSNTETFLWQPPPEEVGPKVPWPQRPLPALALHHPGVTPVRLKLSDFDGLGINIGDVRRADAREIKTGEGGTISMFEGVVKPESFIYTNGQGNSLFPAVLYRFQVASPALPQVSGDLVQVSPLMKDIAAVTTNVPNVGVFTRVDDPFIRVTGLGQVAGTKERSLVLLDTTPVILGANYAYLLVRFDDAGEVINVIPTTLVEVTP